MRIVLAEERQGQEGAPRVFDQATVRVGRDPSECQLIFEQAEWPMVSRKHAEFRLKADRCLLVDINSSFGTILDGRRITEPAEVHPGARVQFGARGPVIKVVHIEFDAQVEKPPVDFAEMDTKRDLTGSQPVREPAVSAPYKQPVPPVAPQPPIPAPAAPTPVIPSTSRQPASQATIELVRTATGRLERIAISKELVRLGRDPEMDIAIDADSAVVSRRHAEIRRSNGQFVIVDLGSFNGTLINDQRITAPTPLYDGDRIQLGMGGPILKFSDPSHPAVLGAEHPAQRAVPGPAPQMFDQAAPGQVPGMHTIVVKAGSGALQRPSPAAGAQQPQLLMQLGFDGRPFLKIGRAADNEVRLDGLQISNYHARLHKSGETVFIEDVGSTNGVYVNGVRITGRRPITAQDIILVGPFVIQADPFRGIAVFDTRSKTRIDCIDITKEVANRSGPGKIKLLDDVDLSIEPNEFVGLLGPSGAGKSTLMDSLNGMRPATSGYVLINNLDLYRHLDSLKQSIGYVPQDDIIHRELTVYRTLYYVARLRLSRDVSSEEIDQIVNEVMDVTGLSERRDVPVGQLSGGQRKRVSIAVELITKPSVIFLDEPTSGLDPATEEKIMRLFRQIAESGRTVILTTHAMENVKLFDKIVVMMRGKLVFYGPPQEALAHIKADSFKDLYDRLEAPVDERTAKLPPLPRHASKNQKEAYKLQKEQIADQVAEEWKQKFHQTEQFRRYIVQPLSGLKRDVQPVVPVKRRPTVTDSLRQWATLARRYAEVLVRDRVTLLILFGQAPLIGFLTYLVVGEKSPRDFPYFMLALVAIWFGTSVAAREIIRERAVYNRERMVNLGLLPYVASKLVVLSVIVGIQCALLFSTLKFFHYVGIMNYPGWALPQFIVMAIAGMVGISMGLFVSAVVKTSEMATSLVPLLLIPQILFSGLVGVPEGVSRVVGVVMPATWAFDEMKRLSTLDTLREEGSDPDGPNEGRGLYKHTEDINDANIEKARRDIRRYKDDAEENSREYERKMESYTRDSQIAAQSGSSRPSKPEAPKLGDPPEPPEAVKVPDDLSNYIDFLHPWGNVVVNPILLLMMFFGLVGATIIALRTQDIG